MLYVIGTTMKFSGALSYTIFEPRTESSFSCSEEFLKKLLIERKMIVRNASQVEGEVQIENWGNQLHHEQNRASEGPTHVALCKLTDDKFKIVSYKGVVRYINRETINTYVKENKIYNSIMADGKPSLVGTYNTDHDTEYEKDIAEKYKKHVALTAMLGRKTTFEYGIEGEEVIIITYGDSTENLIIPNFVTAIRECAFMGRGIKSLTIGTGLKYIGANAFEDCSISEVIVPKNVRFIGSGAFLGNKRLVNTEEKYTNNIKILGKSTLSIAQFTATCDS